MKNTGILSPDMAVINQVDNAFDVLESEQLRKKILRIRFARKHISRLTLFHLISTLLFYLLIVSFAILGVFHISFGYNMVLDFIFISIIFVSFILNVIFGILATVEKRDLSILNKSLKEAWNYRNKEVNQEVKSLMHTIVDDPLFSVVEGVKGDIHFLNSVEYMVDGLNHELVLIGATELRAKGDSIKPSYIFSLVFAAILTIAIIGWLALSLALYPNSFETIGLGVLFFIIAGGLFICATPYNLALNSYFVFVDKTYKYITEKVK